MEKLIRDPLQQSQLTLIWGGAHITAEGV